MTRSLVIPGLSSKKNSVILRFHTGLDWTGYTICQTAVVWNVSIFRRSTDLGIMLSTLHSLLVGSADNYRLNIEGFEGDVFDGMAIFNNQEFSTSDHGPEAETARSFSAGWWYDENWVTGLTYRVSTRWLKSRLDGLSLSTAEIRFVCSRCT